MEETTRSTLLASGHPSAEETYKALTDLLKEQLVRQARIEEARGILKTMMAHRKRLGELQQQYGRIVPETDASGVPWDAESRDVQNAANLQNLPIDVVSELVARELELTKAALRVCEGAIRQGGSEIIALHRRIPWVQCLCTAEAERASKAGSSMMDLDMSDVEMSRLRAEKDRLLEEVQEQEAARGDPARMKGRVQEWQRALHLVEQQLAGIMQPDLSLPTEERPTYNKWREQAQIKLISQQMDQTLFTELTSVIKGDEAALAAGRLAVRALEFYLMHQSCDDPWQQLGPHVLDLIWERLGAVAYQHT